MERNEEGVRLLEGEKRESKVEQKSAFDLTFLKQLTTLLKINYHSKWTIIISLFTFLLAIGQIYIVSFTGEVNGGFYQTISDRNLEQFWKTFILAVIVILLSAFLDSTIKFLCEVLAWRWRRTLCLHLQSEYLMGTLYYKVISFNYNLDNPDQRITQDVDNFSSTLAILFQTFLGAPFIIIFYTIKTWMTIAWYAPLIVCGFFSLGWLINKLIMSPIVNLVFKQEQLEGNFRFDHVRIRTFAESIALYDGGSTEKEYTEKAFEQLLVNKLTLLKRQWSLNTSSNSFSYLGSILNYLVVAMPIFFIDSNVSSSPKYIGEASFYCISLIYGFSTLINMSKTLSDLAGYTARIAKMLETLKQIKDSEHESAGNDQFNGTLSAGDCIEFNDVTCYTPTGIKLTEKLTFKIESGTNLLIMGPTGSGKSSLLRVMNGLWPFYNGNITKPIGDRHSMFYLPQKPYLFTGTIKQQIVYPKDTDTITDLQVRDLLKMVGLNRLIRTYSIHNILNWPDTLSPGEQQLVSFARLIYHQPTFAILDEATSALQEELERKLYALCKEQGITLISVGHRNTLKSYHNFLLQLEENHQWTLQNIQKTEE